MLFLIGKGNLGEQAGCALTGLGSDDSRIILGSRPDRLRTGMDVSCVLFHILRLECDFSLQAQCGEVAVLLVVAGAVCGDVAVSLG